MRQVFYRLQMKEGAGGETITDRLLQEKRITSSIEFAGQTFDELSFGDIVLVHKGSYPSALVKVINKIPQDEVSGKTFGTDYSVEIISRYDEVDAEFRTPHKGTFAKVDSNSNTYREIYNWYNLVMNEIMIEETIALLKSNKNLILTGAPGTGKTYLAKQIALKMLFGKASEDDLSDEEKEQFKHHYSFVQFHPSYDYTDFVEGLRPIKKETDNELGFELRDGTFKEFCKRAIRKPQKDNFDELYDQFAEDMSEKEVVFETPKYKKKFKVEINSNKSCVAIPETEIGTRMSITKNMIKDYVLYGKIRDWKPYTTPIGDYLNNNYDIKLESRNKDDRPYVFVIDEINRAEISKVFGELFFTLDPGYRGPKGKVKTQYANLQEGDTVFDEEEGTGWFYIPENVYIIGTMNDIDRSVESFDFAMRRRFAWKEISAEDREEMLDEVIPDWAEEAKRRMNAINLKIEKMDGLGSSYHIGPAYFLKLENYEGDFNQLWENHIKIVLQEYLRGLPDAKVNLDSLKEAYDNNKE